jgi:hypothetical protein
MTAFEGIKGLSALCDRGLIEIELAPLTDVDIAQQLNEKMSFLRRMAIVRAMLFAGAGIVVILWIRKMFLSVESMRFFSSWAEFF